MSETAGGTIAFKRRRKLATALLSLIAIFVIGDIDYLTGYQISLLVFYILPVGFAVIYVGPEFAIFLALLSVSISICTDFWSGMPYSEIPTLAWNILIVLSVFFIVIGLLHTLNRILVKLEASVEQRTQALLSEMKERGRLEREIIDLSEHEQLRLGQELHDVVCQELASVSIAAHMLARKLTATQNDESGHAQEIAQMTDQALETAQSVARGFFTAGFDSAGLAEALQETARDIERKSQVNCEVRWEENLTIKNETAVIHLFRIAREAIRNAIKHSGCSKIQVSLERKDDMLQLVVEDNGKGKPGSPSKGKGLGQNIMAYRAGLIGGQLRIENPSSGGTRMVCLVPLEKLNQPVPANP